MTQTTPHYGNLRKRAAKLGYQLTRVTDEWEAVQYGGHEYVMHTDQAGLDHGTILSLYGIRNTIEVLEQG